MDNSAIITISVVSVIMFLLVLMWILNLMTPSEEL
jgi:hypothetical protein